MFTGWCSCASISAWILLKRTSNVLRFLSICHWPVLFSHPLHFRHDSSGFLDEGVRRVLATDFVRSSERELRLHKASIGSMAVSRRWGCGREGCRRVSVIWHPAWARIHDTPVCLRSPSFAIISADKVDPGVDVVSETLISRHVLVSSSARSMAFPVLMQLWMPGGEIKVRAIVWNEILKRCPAFFWSGPGPGSSQAYCIVLLLNPGGILWYDPLYFGECLRSSDYMGIWYRCTRRKNVTRSIVGLGSWEHAW